MSRIQAGPSTTERWRADDARILSESDVVRLKRCTCVPTSSASQREFLEELEAKAMFVDPAEIPPDVVTMNTTFECVSGDGVEVHEWTLAYPDEADYREGRISVLSATGMGLLGARCGQTVTIRAPNDVTIRYLIRRVLFQPESRHFGK